MKPLTGSIRKYPKYLNHYKFSYNHVQDEMKKFDFYRKENSERLQDLRRAIEKNETERWIKALQRRIKYIHQCVQGFWTNVKNLQKHFKVLKKIEQVLRDTGNAYRIDESIKMLEFNMEDCEIVASVADYNFFIFSLLQTIFQIFQKKP